MREDRPKELTGRNEFNLASFSERIGPKPFPCVRTAISSVAAKG